MTNPDRPRVRGTEDPRPEESLEAGKKTPTARDGEKKKPAFRFTRLDGRDTLKYEDTADK